MVPVLLKMLPFKIFLMTDDSACVIIWHVEVSMLASTVETRYFSTNTTRKD